MYVVNACIYRDDKHYTLLTTASMLGQVGCVKALLEYGANKDILCEKVLYTRAVNASPIYLASVKGCVEMIKLLLEHGATLNSPTCSPLCGACLAGDIELVKFLIDLGAEVTFPSVLHRFSQWTSNPLAEAARSGNVELVEYLISKGADIHCDKRDQNPLISACSCDRYGVIELLLHHGADIDVQVEFSEFTCMHQACIDDNVEMVRFLLDRGAEINILDCDEQTPLAEAFKHNDIELLTVLLERGADPDISLIYTPYRWTPLMLAVAEGDTETIELLLQHGAKVDITMIREGANDADGILITTPLLIACEYGQVDALRLLLEHGADASQQFEFYHYNTPLMYLFRGGLWVVQRYYGDGEHAHELEPDRTHDMHGCLKLLLKYGADVTYTNDEGLTVYDYMEDQPDVLQIFAEHSVEATPLLK